MQPISIQQDAIFIADSHHHSLYNNVLDDFLISLLKSKKRQIFFMGDIFDFLVGEVSRSITDNQKTLEILKKLSLKHELHYFEGNHDFSLQNLPFFKNIHYYPLAKQPICFLFNQQKAYLAHGDIFLNWHYHFYAHLIRNHFILSFLNCFNSILYPKILSYLQNKNKIKYNYPKDFINNRIRKYQKKLGIHSDSYIIEGHFHLGEIAKLDSINYIGLPLFTCKKTYFIVESNNYSLSFKTKEF